MGYDDRYLAGILLFNSRDFFEAHEVWEDLWMETAGDDKRFFQGLIQAAVALYHFGNGNLGGALKLFKSGRAYMERYPSPHLGLDRAAFWERMADCFAELLAAESLDRRVQQLDEARIPVLALSPAPETWPNPEDFLEADAD